MQQISSSRRYFFMSDDSRDFAAFNKDQYLIITFLLVHPQKESN